MEVLIWFAERHPLLMCFVISLAVMAIADSEVLSSLLWACWAGVGITWFFYRIAKEGGQL